ncbi:toxin-antitoxin system YwqK family antitoxin [Gilliamella sp. Pas-s25]|uniref:toxin-antitoxin system YwqK family antitoxin n=1 Tax=Gilliamella sp. Pas-s25 TaxID=2687310 RepID=UPI00135E8B47|nr:toxin-antitoxin system YwqK family antitoxin [Gilliamella sp. Pas-s25]MWP62148.1 hypothetical protein [Gilliamella sp. Pas-s25]
MDNYKIIFKKIVLILGITLTTYSANADNENIIKYISKIKNVNTMKPTLRRIDDTIMIEMAERIFFSEETPCGKKYQSINAKSIDLSDEEYYGSFWSNLSTHIKNEEYFLITSEPCDSIKGEPLITNIQVCNSDICDKKYLPANDIMWIMDYEGKYYFTVEHDASYYIDIPLIFDEDKKLWKIKGWYFKDDDNKLLDKPLLAFDGYTSTDVTKNNEIKFSNFFTFYYLSGNKMKEVPYNSNGEIDGLFISYHDTPDSKVFEKVPFKNNKKEGKAIVFYKDGSIESQPIYHQDFNIDGSCNHYFPNGQIYRQHTYLNGKYEGDYIDYYENGQILEKSTYHNGKKVGISEKFYDTGERYSISHYDDEGLSHGEFVIFDKDGSKKTNYIYDHGKTIEHNNWKNGIKTEESFYYNENKQQHLDGVHRVWYDDGKLKLLENYNKGNKDGVFQRWYPNNKLEYEKIYKNNQLISSIEWNEKGIKVSEAFYDMDGLEQGEWKEWHDDGTKKKIAIYKNGKLDNRFQRWYKNGQLKEDEFYKQDKLDGVQKYWHENGKLAREKNYIDGVLFGTYTSWNEDGLVESIMDYEQGNFVSLVSYRYNDNNQKIIEYRKKYVNGKAVIEKITFDEKGKVINQTTQTE